MDIWAIGDLHLSFGTPNKKMDVFGPSWQNHAAKIGAAWDACVAPQDLVLIPGDISWAMRLEDALPDLQWIDARPGTKVLIKGNHDYWWGSLKKVRQALPSSLHVVQNDTFSFGNISIGGAKLWDSDEFSFSDIINYTSEPPPPQPYTVEDNDLLQRELLRLEMSLQAMPKEAGYRIAMTHFPPIGTDLASSRAAALFEQYGIALVVFGHLHSLKANLPPLFGTARGVRYVLASSDYLNFSPVKLATIQ